MSLTYNPPKVFIDTTLLCAALRGGPDSFSRKLLRLARAHFYKPIISNVCLFEFYRQASTGLKNVQYSYVEIELFLTEFVYPLLGDEGAINSLCGRYDFEVVLESNRPIGEMLVKFSGCSTEEAKAILVQGPMKELLHKYDENDFHVWITAIKSQANVILTSNTNRFPKQIGNMNSIHPKIFLKYLGLEESFELVK
jgi:hypothetical protein